MDLTSILPLLMGNKNPEMAKILSAMNGASSSKGTSDKAGSSTSDILASFLASQNKAKDNTQKAQGDNDSIKNNEADMQAKLLSSLMGGGSQAELLMNLMSTMNKQKPAKQPSGFVPIQKIAPNDILGAMLKYFGV